MKAYLKGYLKITDDKVASDYAPLSGEAVAPDPSAPVIVGLPVISGVERAGETLTATPASVTGYPTPDITWQWERSGSPISGATNSTYLLVAADIGETITVVQTATNSEGSDTANGWKYRLVIPIRPTQSALTGFTAVLTDAMLPEAVKDVLFHATTGALADGGDLRVTADEDGEIIVGLDALRRWDKAAGKMEIAYFVPSTSAALTTTLYLWWGKDNATQPAAGAVGGQHSAYDNDTIFCAPVGGGANRTAFNITGTDVGGITAGDIAAPSGLLGTQHTDVGDYSTYGDNPDLDLVNTDWTMSFLFRATTSGQEQYVLGKYDHTTDNRGYLCILSPSQHFDLIYKPERNSYDPIYRISSGVDVVDGQWHHLAGTFISGTRASVYTDGILRNTTTNNIPSSVASNDASFQIGTQVTSQNLPADFSHVTVHSVARSAEWLKAENDNFRDPNSFYGTFPAPENVQTATNSEGSDAAESAATGVIGDALTAPVINGLPTITGAELVGEILTATPASVTGNPTPDITWQWERSGSPISGATNSTYLLVAADIGETITVVQTATNSEGSDAAESAATGVIGDALTAPVINGLPTITGAELVGEILTATPASVTGNPTPDITWQWERSGSPISGATNSTYLLVAADIGETITVVQTATNSEGSDAAESAATGVIGDALTAPVINGLPTITGAELVGEILTATPASVTGNPTPDITWQWERSGSPISGATNSTYLLVAADIGETITVVQTATNSEGSDTAESAATGAIPDVVNGWKYRLVIPIRPTQSALTGFTAVLTDAMLPAAVTDVLFDATEGALASGGDLRVTADEDGEIIVGLDALRRWDKAAGKMEIAYFVPSTSAALTTTLYLWWGKDNATQPAAGAVGGRYAAYDNDTIFCAPVGGGANRTAFNITGTDVGGIIAGDTAAPSGLLGTKHTDVGDYSTYGDNPDLDLINTDWTISFLFRATTSGLEQYVLGKYDHTTQNRGYLCMFSGSQHFDLTYQPVPTSYDPTYRLSSGVDVADGQWHHLAGTFISGTRASVYTDGILRNTATNNIPSSVASNDASFQIGTQVTSQNRPADFSHVTVHSVARSAEWLKAENDNFRDPNSFYDSFPAPENVDIELPY
jgi:hypothetical protein